jgi:hypothetical protein
MKAAVYKIITLFLIIFIFSATAGNIKQLTVAPAACRPVDKNPDGLSDDINNYGCGFHIVFNATLY